ncbi:hypothetical protein [Olegusella massiliensis]|uniref:hypothetical protein n=1 Tax=Olegusella massiliensis TaxID=1776381 RepID=UPI000837D739|nr:hypothetical protein [Olegusella massiliensis]
MRVTDYQTFVTIYMVLDAAYDKSKSKKTLAFIGDANPNIWKGRTPGDPALFYEFSEKFVKRFANRTP